MRTTTTPTNLMSLNDRPTAVRVRRAARPLSRLAALAVGLAAAFGAASVSRAAGVLDVVPADAMVVIKVSDLAATSGKVAKLATELGLDMFQPQLQDPLGALKQELKIEGGLNDNGELALVLLDPSKHDGDEDQATLLLVPTSDFAALTAGFEEAKVEGNVTAFQGPQGESMFASDWGNGYAAIAQNRTLVETKPTEFVKPTERALQALGENDIAMYANMTVIRDPATKQLESQREDSKESFLEGMRRSRTAQNADGNENTEKAISAVGGAVFDQFYNAVEAFVRDADAGVVGLTLTDGGIRENFVADFKSDSYLGGVTAKLKGSDQPLVTGLPSTPYLVYGGLANTAEVTNQLIDDLAKPIVDAIPADAATADGKSAAEISKEVMDGVKKYSSSVQMLTWGMATPQGALGQDGIFQVIGTVTGNADQVLQSMREMSDTNAELSNALMSAVGEGPQLEQTWTDDARKVGDVSFSTITTNVLGDSAQATQARQQMQFMYGTEKVEALVGKVSDQKVVSFVNVSDELMQQVIAATKANESPLAGLDHVKSVADQLPKNRVFEVYIAVDEIATTGIRFANQMGFFQGNVQLPPDLPPVGVALSSSGSSLQGSVYISSDLLQALVSAGMQLSQRRQGGGGGGGL